MKTALHSFAAGLFIVLILVGRTKAQETPNLDRGLKPYGSYQAGNIDVINLSNGNISLHQVLRQFPQRGGKLDLDYFFKYNNKSYVVNENCDPTSGCNPFWTLRDGLGVADWLAAGVEVTQPFVATRSGQSVVVGCDQAANTCEYDFFDSVGTVDGSAHALGILPHTGYLGAGAGFSGFYVFNGARSLDGSNLYVGSDGTVVFPSGVRQYPVFLNSLSGVFLEDSNGNQISWADHASSDPTQNYQSFTDTLGRILPGLAQPLSDPNTLGYLALPAASDYTGCAGPYPTQSARQMNFPAYGGGSTPTVIKLCFVQIPVQTNFGVAGISEFCCGNMWFLQSIVLPDSTAWTFEYNSRAAGDSSNINYGDLTKVTFPTGGTLSYVWQNVPFCSPDPATGNSAVSRAVASRTLNANDGTGDHTWKYQFAVTKAGSPITTTVTDPLGNRTVHTFTDLTGTSCAYYETQARYSDNSNTLLRTITTNYVFSTSVGATAPAYDVFPTSVTTTLPNGKVSEVDHSYLGVNTTGAAGTFSFEFLGKTYSAGMGNLADEYDYDYGSSSKGALLRQIHTDYLFQGNGAYLNLNLVDLASKLVTYDGGGTRFAQTTYGYDEANPTGSGITTQLNTSPVNGPTRGNRTSVNQWSSTTGTSLTSTVNWYNTGEVLKTIDPSGNPTTHTYDPVYAGAYSTKTCNALSQCVSGTYDYNTGLLTSFTDANGSYGASGNTQGDPAHTSNYGYDNMLRLTLAQSPPDPSGNRPQASLNFPSPTEVDKSSSVTTGLNNQLQTFLDGLGRPVKTVHSSAGNATVVTTYDTLGRLASVTNPYFSTSDPTYGVTQTQYDALGRMKQVTKPDNSTVATQYDQTSANSPNGDCSTATDEAGNARKSCVDGLGRLIEVDEPGKGTNGPGTPGMGSISISGSLYSATTSGSKATGWFSVSGSDEFVLNCGPGGLCNPKFTPKTWDWGDVQLTINGTQASVQYGKSSTGADLATSLAGALNPHPITFSDSGTGTINLAADVPGPNYSLSGVAFSNDPADFGAGSFSIAVSGASLSGGVYPVTSYDSGTVTVRVGSFQASAPYSQSGNSTAAQVAAALVSSTNPNGLNRSGSPVTASVSGTTISMTANGVGTATNYTVTGSSTASFTASSTTLSGGTNPGGLNAAWVTQYSYDPLGNLTQVNQQGDGSQAARVRSFTYDSLSHLLAATNPESGKISYSYDANGNVLSKTSPAPNQSGTATQTISYCYDALNRVTGKAYSAQSCPLNSPAVTYTYDSGTNGIGHLTSLTDQAGSGGYSYDALGRMTNESRTIAGTTKNLAYTYNLDGSVSALQYPSTAVVTYTPDAAGRALSAVDAGNSINYVSNATYGADNSLTGFISGQGAGANTFAGISNSVQYNSRLQVCRITALTTGTLPATCSDSTHTGNVLDLGYNLNLGNGDNGNVAGITNYRDTSRSQSFTYDALNRLTSAQNAGTDCTQKTANNATKYWGNNYSYDAWGNLLGKSVTKCSAESLNITALANNQLSGYGYDAAGNMTHDATTGNNYSFDAENRITGAAGYTYTYDADGNRVEKSNGSTGTIYWYMSPGIVAESDLTGNLTSEYVFFDGERVARRDFPSGAVSYYFSDELKTASVITDAAGSVKEDEDYYPWGGELKFVDNDSNHYKFGGHERDNETGLDYMLARYYSNPLGRFLTPDWAAKPIAVPYANFGNPQSLNLYTYGKNNPTTLGDPDGHCPTCDAVWEGAQLGAEAGAPGGPWGVAVGTVVGGVGAGLGLGYISSKIEAKLASSSTSEGPQSRPFLHPDTEGAIQKTLPGTTPTTVQTTAPATTPTTVNTATPASTSQAGTVNTGPIQNSDLGHSATTKQTGAQGQNTVTTVTDAAGSTTYKTTPGKTGGQSTIVVRKDANGNTVYVKQEARTNNKDFSKAPDHVHYKKPIDKQVTP